MLHQIQNVIKYPFTKFIIIGCVSTFINYTIFIYIYLILLVDYKMAFLVGYVSGIAFSYLFNRLWTFEIKNKTFERDILKYLFVYTITLCIGSFVLHFLVNRLELSPSFANVITLFVTTYLNYIGVRFWVFR